MDTQAPPEPPERSGLAGLWAELKRRKVMRVAITYAVVAWLVIQIAVATFPKLLIPEWAESLVIMCVILGFPVAVILTWAFELTPDGIQTTKMARQETIDSKEAASHSEKRNWFWALFGAAVPTLIFGVLALFFYVRSGGDSQSVEYDKSIAVLPLENMSPDPNNAYFADGVQDHILTNLASIQELSVIGRTSTLQYRGTIKTLKQIGEELGVNYLLEGSVQRAEDQVLINLQLIDTQTEAHLWAKTYDREFKDIFAIQSDIATKVAGQLKAVLTPEELTQIEQPPTENLEAYDLFLLSKSKRYENRIPLLEQAVELDPEFMLAWEDLAYTAIRVWNETKFRNDPVLLKKAHKAFRKLAEKASVVEFLLQQNRRVRNEFGDIEESIGYLLEALALDPDNHSVHAYLGRRYMHLGRLTEAQNHLETALLDDPLYRAANVRFPLSIVLSDLYIQQDMWFEARELIDKILKSPDLYKRSRDFWLWKNAYLKYRETGNREAFEHALNVHSFNDNRGVVVSRAIVSRNLEYALQLIEQENAGGFINTFELGQYWWDLSLRSEDILSALILFELGRIDDASNKAKAVSEHLKVSELDPVADPDFGSNLAISSALEGKRAQMEATIPKVRERSGTETNQYRFQLKCEMHIAMAYLILGDHEKAVDTLEAAKDLKGPIKLNQMIDYWFIFDRLKGNPRFDALLKD